MCIPPTPTPTPLPFDVEKVYRQTDVCFEENNDGDVEAEGGAQIISEDCVETEGESCEGPCGSAPCVNGICQVDNDDDGLFSEDCTECGGESSPGTLLPMIGNVFQLNPVLKRNGRIASYNPGQYYAVSTVTALEDIDFLWITEDYDMCTNITEISKLNPSPNRGGGNVLLVLEEDGEFIEVLNSKADEININTDPDNASVHLEDIPEGSILHVYVKFKPGLKNDPVPTFPDNMCMNFNTAQSAEQTDPLCPGASNCCETGHGSGCDDSNCETIVCAIDPYCCNNTWDGICVDEAEEFCDIILGPENTAKANLIVGDGPPWLPAGCNFPGEACNLSECGGDGICYEADPSAMTGGLGICADFGDEPVGVQLCPGGQDDCDANPDSICADIGVASNACISPSFMCPDLS